MKWLSLALPVRCAAYTQSYTSMKLKAAYKSILFNAASQSTWTVQKRKHHYDQNTIYLHAFNVEIHTVGCCSITFWHSWELLLVQLPHLCHLKESMANHGLLFQLTFDLNQGVELLIEWFNITSTIPHIQTICLIHNTVL